MLLDANTLNYFGPGGIKILNGTGYSHAWFNGTVCSASITANCFPQPDNLQFGNLSPNVISGPGNWFLDLSLFREIAIKERLKLQLRGEGFSIFNTPQWNNLDTNIGNARTPANPNGTFGYITGAGGNRQIQFGAKVIF
jgi:hypothetical protein